VNLAETGITSTARKISRLRQKTKERLDDKNERGTWGYYNSEIESYASTFSTVLPMNLLDFTRGKGDPVIIDFMAPTGTIRNLCKQTGITPKIAIAVSLQDQRTQEEKDADDALNIYQLAGNLLDFKTWTKLTAMLSGEKADLIMERAVLGLIHIPGSKFFYDLTIRGLWNILDENGGLLLAQTHNHNVLRNVGIDFTKWSKQVAGSEVDICIDSDKRTLMLQKNPMSPTYLPKF